MFQSTSKWRSAILFFAVWTLVVLIFSAVSYAAELGNRTHLGLFYSLRLNLVYFYLWGFLSLFIFRFSYRFPIEFRPFEFRNLLLHIPVIFLFSIIHQSAYLAINWYFTPAFQGRFTAIAQLYRAYFAFGLYLGFIISTLFVIVAHAYTYYQNFRAGEVQRSELKAQLAQAQLQSLKMQLHPHFLFNTLHSISSLVLEDPPRANSMIARLGDFLRLTLEHSDEQLVMLQEEIAFLRCYLEIEQVRFEDRLTVDFKIEPATLSASVPQLILQPIVENAIRHAIAPRAAQGCIKIETRRLNGRLWLEVKDNGPGINTKSNSVERQGVGLSNVRARLKQIYGTEFRFELTNVTEGGLSVILEVPFRYELSDGVGGAIIAR